MAVFLSALLLIALVNYLSPWLIPVTNLSTLLYSLLLLAWAISVYRRILLPQVRRCFVGGGCLLVLMFIMRLLRYNLPPNLPTLSKYLWYAYYIPMTAVPLEAFSASLFMGREEGAEAPHYLRWLWRLWLPMVALVMANDLHGWMFRIMAESDGAFRYSYGVLYYFVFGWIGTFSIGSLVLMMWRCRLSQCRRLWYVPVLAAAPGFFLLMWYVARGGTAPELFGHKLFNYQEAYAILFLFVWESCIQIGLIQCNTDYEKIFSLLPLNTLIADKTGSVRFSAYDATVPGAEKLFEARKAPVNIDDDHVLYSRAIRDGTVYWIEDVSAVNEVNRKIASAIEYLQDEQSLLDEEAKIKAERASYETQNRIYDSLSPLVRPQLAAAQRLLSEDIENNETVFREHLTLAMVLCVYVKRRVNLALLASKNDRMPVDELKLAVQETLEYLRLRGVVCGVECSGGTRELPTAKLLLAYDFFASVVEEALPKLSALFVLLRANDAFCLDLNIGTPTDRLAEGWRLQQRESLGAAVTWSEGDGLSYARLRFREGVEE